MPTLCFTLTLALLAHVQPVQCFLPGVTSALYGDVPGHSEFELNLSPPEESAQAVEQSLGSISNLESVKNTGSLEDFARERQRMLNAEKAAIHDMVAEAFAPLRAKMKAA